MTFYHPKYYKELRKLRNKSDQAISQLAEPVAGRRAPGQGHKQQASSAKLLKQQATSIKPQATSVKLKATSIKLQDSWTTKKFYGAWTEGLDEDKSIVRMLHVKRNLVWREPYFIPLAYLQFYCEKVPVIITDQ